MWAAELVSRPRPLTPSYFSDRSEAVGAAASAQAIAALRAAQLLNASDFLLQDPRCAGHTLAAPLRQDPRCAARTLAAPCVRISGAQAHTGRPPASGF